MKEDQMLALLARLCGDITLANNNDANQVFKLQEAIASAIINDPSLQTSTSFQFEETENFTTQHLDAADMQHLSGVLQKVQDSPQVIDPNIRVFRREVPVVSSQLRGSVPAWARGGRIEETIGPIINRDGRRFFFDIYRVIPVVQVWLQGAARPFILLPLEVGNLVTITGPRKYKIPKGSVWLHADLFAPPSPDNLYCGLTVASGELNLSSAVNVSTDNKIIIPVGTTASVVLNLEQQAVTDVSPDDHGIDAKEATIELPKTLSLSLSHTGKAITAGDAKWNVYGQALNFTFDKTKPMRWVPELNRVAIPYKWDVPEFAVHKCKSPVCTISGKAKIADASWVLSAAAINIAAPVQADGIGAMAIGVTEGLTASWLGLKDANLFEKSFASLKNAMVMVMPGRVNIATLFAYNPTGKQRYNLWQAGAVDGIQKPVQYIDLNYTKQFFFFYDSLQKGTETISAQANCITSVNKPVKVDGSPFKVESLQTVFTLSISKALQIVMLYDDNILADNWSKTAKAPIGATVPPVMFKSTAIALNNALLTVSPVYGMLLYGDLKNEDSFDKCLLVFSFGLVQYLPTLPDPYAANVSFMKRRRSRINLQLPPNEYFLTEITALLIGVMGWDNMDEPPVNFFLGDKPPTVQNTISVNTGTTNRFDVLKNVETLDNLTTATVQRASQLKAKSWQAVTDDLEGSNRIIENDNNTMRMANERVAGNRLSPFRNAFALLDVSTNADLMGVSVGLPHDDLIFRQTHSVQPEMQGNPISINGLDVQATSRLVQVYALPQISWEPMVNFSEVTNVATDPHPGILYFLNDGIPAQIANTGNKPITLAPLPLTKNIAALYNKDELALWSYFTLSYGMLALALYYRYEGKKPGLELIHETFANDVSTGLQIKTTGFYHDQAENIRFKGSAHQLKNVNNYFSPATNNRSVLGGSVTKIFNPEFGSGSGFDPTKYIPLERYDFSGYGANVFSHWINEKAALAQTSQAMFDVWRGRTAHEVIQVKSVLYPWAIRVVRTITIHRGSSGLPWRTDSGWKAESDGIYDFRSPVELGGTITQAVLNAEEANSKYTFHPGMVDGVFNVRNIKEDPSLKPYEVKGWNKNYGLYIDNDGVPQPVGGGQNLEIFLQPVYFDADVQIDNVTQGADNGRVVSRRMLGYLQLAPRGVFISKEHFEAALLLMDGLGGPVDCSVNINGSDQMMRVARVEVNPSRNAANQLVFVTSAKGTPILPKDGSWSVVEHNATTKEVLPLTKNNSVPLIREGERIFDLNKLTYQQNKKDKPVNVAEASELFKALASRTKQYGFLQSTGENKILFRNPLFELNTKLLKGSVPDLADAYHLMNSKGIFPKIEGLPSINEIGSNFEMQIKEKGYQLLNKIDPLKKLSQKIEGKHYLINEQVIKIYIEYKPKDNTKTSALDLVIDSENAVNGWVNKMNDVSMYVDLAGMEKLLVIRGKFETEKGKAPSFVEPIMEFGEKLQPVYEILLLLASLSTDPNYTELLKKGLKIAMSNSPNNWEYKFQADKEIPVVRFPPSVVDTAAVPLRIEASLKAGIYFNVALQLPPTNGIQAPSIGAFVEFYGKLSVMCVSVGVGTIFAVGQATVRISADSVTGPALYMKFGFGVEAVVALPVIGSVSVYFAVGVEMLVSAVEDTLGGFVLFRGRAEILGGIVTVTIQIEASGQVQKRVGGATNMKAQVTFSLDISVCFIINISIEENSTSAFALSSTSALKKAGKERSNCLKESTFQVTKFRTSIILYESQISILTFPQQWQNNELTVRVVVMPRNLNPLQPIVLDGGVNAPAWPDWNMQLQAKLVSDGDKYPSITLSDIDTFDLIGISMPQNIAPIFEEMDTQLGGIPATSVNNQLKPAKASDGAKKYLPESYRGSFNFTTPRTPDAVTDDSYKCALRDKPSEPFTPSGRDFLCWGKVFAHCLRQPALAKRVGFVYEATFAVDPAKLKNGSWLYIDFGPDCSFTTSLQAAPIADIEKQKLVKRYAAKLPKLKPNENRSLFASVQFPVLIDGGVTLNNEDFPIAPKAFDDLIIEAAQYDDGFCKIVHAVQPVSGDLLREKEDKDLPVITDAGIRLGWDDEQILIWMNRQLKPDTSLLPAGRRTDAPMGVMQYRVDVRLQSDEAINPNPWTPLCKVRNKASLVMGGEEIDAANNEVELGVEVYPAKPLPGQNFWLPQYFADWIGKSVVLPDKNAIEIFQKEKNTAPDRQATKFDLYDEAGLEAMSLLYGNKYEFRVRLADISGGGPDLEDTRRYNAPSPEAKCHFKRYVQPQAVRLQNELPLRDDVYFNDDVLTMQRPLLGYPSVLFTGKYPNAVADLIADAEANLVESAADATKQRPVGLADPDVVKVEILVEVKALEMDMQLRYDTDSHESYAFFYKTNRNFPADFNGALDVPITFVDAPVLNFIASQDLGELGLVVGGDSIDDHNDILLPRARDVRITLRAVAEGSNDYFANTTLAKKGKPISFIMRRVATNEENLFKELSSADYVRGIWLQPDVDTYLKASTTEVFVENTSNQFITSMMDRLVDDIDKTLEVEAKGLSLVGKPGKRIQFGASRLIRHNLSPDSTSITFSTKSDLLNQWIVPITLILNRDWTWDGVKPVSFEIYRQVKFVGAGLTDEEREAIAWPARQLVGDVEMKQAISVQALQGADRSQTYFCFLDAVEPKPKNSGFPEEMMVQYAIEPRFRLNENNDAIPTDEPLTLQLHLPMTGKPSQLPEIVSAGIAQSKYMANADYSGTEPRRRYLWIEFAEPLQNENDAYFIRMTAYAPDPLLAKWSLNMLEAVEEPPLPIDPELIRTISTQHSDDRSGLNAMQELIPANKKQNKPLVHYLVPLPPGLHASSAELFGFFTYELRVGHKKGWSTAQARYGRALRTTGVQHPPPQLFCIVQRNKKHIMVNAPYAQTVFNGANVTTNPPRTQLWALLYAQVRRADGKENRNILLDDQLFIRKRPTKNAAGVNIIDINTDAVQYGITGWRNKDVEKMLLDYGLPVDSNLSVLVVEMMPTYEKFFARPANQNTALMVNRNVMFDNANLKQGMFIKHFSNAVNTLTSSAAQLQLRLEENRQLKLEEGFISQAEKNETVRPLTEQLGSERILRTEYIGTGSGDMLYGVKRF